MGNNTIGERHIYTQQLVKLLGAASEGALVTYEEMSTEIGIDTRPTGPGYGYQHTARTILQRDKAMVFEVVAKIGLKHMPKTKVAESALRSFVTPMRSLTRRHKRRVGTLDDSYDTLPEKARFQVDATRTLLAFTDHATKRKNIEAIESKVIEAKKMIGFKQTIELFTK